MTGSKMADKEKAEDEDDQYFSIRNLKGILVIDTTSSGHYKVESVINDLVPVRFQNRISYDYNKWHNFNI